MATREKNNYLVNELTARYGFERGHALDAAERLMRHHGIYNDFVQYNQTGQVSDNKYGGYTLAQLVNDYQLEPIGAFLMLVELETDAVQGQYYLNQIIQHGHRVKTVDEDGDEVVEFRTVAPPVREDMAPNSPNCPKCNSELTWIYQYKRWYCYECKEYV